jgi:alkanesulfonate monooxygenase SsuD/methylene tetrahydromethanopterin reductase-like flavin-dependent oxidoreductase (luciferase family)
MADLVGSPAEVVDRLAQYRQIGATRAYFRVLDLRDLDQIALLGATVVPMLAERGGAATNSFKEIRRP